jgi:hypothetical protein
VARVVGFSVQSKNTTKTYHKINAENMNKTCQFVCMLPSFKEYALQCVASWCRESGSNMLK